METRITPEQQQENKKKWHLFFSALLKSQVANLDFQVDIENEDIVINTTDLTLVDTITKVLSSPEHARTSLSYTIANSTKPASLSQVEEILYPDAIEVAHGEGATIFSRILGEANLKRVGCPNWDEEEKETKNEKILFAHDDELEILSQSQVNIYRDIFSRASYADFRNALAANEHEYQPLPKSNKKGILARHIDKILYKKADSFIFDYGLMMKCLIAPKLSYAVAPKEDFQIRVNKKHLISYFSTVIKEGFILLPQGDANAATQQATPITFNMGQAIPVKTNFTFLIDCSTSMETNFSLFKEYIRDYIITITKQAGLEDADIAIIPFDTVIHATKTFTVASLKEDPALLATYFSNLNACGNTTLDLTIARTLQSFENASQQVNNIVIICTDGQDSEQEKNLSELKDSITQIKSKINPPKLYTIGFGKYYDKDKMETLGEITGCERIELNSPEDLKALTILLNLPEIIQARVLATFVQELEATPSKITVVTHENDIGVPKKQGTLTIPGAFMVSGKSYNVVKGAPSLQSASRNQDKEIELTTIQPSALERQLKAMAPEALAKMLTTMGIFSTMSAQPSTTTNDLQSDSSPSQSRSTSPTP